MGIKRSRAPAMAAQNTDSITTIGGVPGERLVGNLLNLCAPCNAVSHRIRP
jgi:hypothetical protein